VSLLFCLLFLESQFVMFNFISVFKMMADNNILVRIFYFLIDFLNAVYRDFLGIIALIQIEYKLGKYAREKTVLADLFRKRVAEHPDKPCILCDNKVWTYKDVSSSFFFCKMIINLL
jgi:hypothetical protein